MMSSKFSYLFLIVVLSLFFIAFGVQLLIAAYHLNDPFSFVLTFFASNLIILISAALCLGFVLKLCRLLNSKATSQRKPPYSP